MGDRRDRKLKGVCERIQGGAYDVEKESVMNGLSWEWGGSKGLVFLIFWQDF